MTSNSDWKTAISFTSVAFILWQTLNVLHEFRDWPVEWICQFPGRPLKSAKINRSSSVKTTEISTIITQSSWSNMGQWWLCCFTSLKAKISERISVYNYTIIIYNYFSFWKLTDCFNQIITKKMSKPHPRIYQQGQQKPYLPKLYSVKEQRKDSENKRKSQQTVLTSSTGSSFSLGKELDSSPTRKGVGQQTISSMEPGSTGMKVCCQENG